MCLKHKILRKSDNFKSICSTFPGPLGPSLPSEESVFLNASRWYVLITTQTILLIDCEKVILENISNFVKIRQIKNVMKVAIGPLSPGPTGPVRVNSPQTSETLWGHKSGSTFDLVMVCCLTTSSHYMNQCWLVISELLWRYPVAIYMKIIRCTSLIWVWIFLIYHCNSISQGTMGQTQSFFIFLYYSFQTRCFHFVLTISIIGTINEFYDACI